MLVLQFQFLVLFNPNLSHSLLLLCGDIHVNPGPPSGVKVAFMNVNSLTAESGDRFLDLTLRLRLENIDVACLCETGCNINLPLFNIEGYHELSDELYKPKCCGLLFYIKDSLGFNRRVDLEAGFDVYMFCEVKSSHIMVLIGLFYRSPSQLANARNEYFSKLDDILSHVLNLNYDLVVLEGDFNARSKYFWSEDISTPEGFQLYDLSVKHSLYECIHEPTTVTANSKPCIDLIFYNFPGLFLNSGVDAPISFSDHCVMSICLYLSQQVKADPVVKRIWKYSRVNVTDLNLAVDNFQSW
jgi:hypothetical protein